MSIEKAIVKHISGYINVPAGLTHPLDASTAKEILKEMSARNFSFDPKIIYAEAVSQGWASSHAKDLSKIAENVSLGKRVVIKHSNVNPAIYEQIILDANL